jgi:hypothetical protein
LINDDNLDWVDEFAKLSSAILKRSNHIYCFTDAEYSAEFILAFRKYGFKIRNLLCIPRSVKGNGGDRIFQQQFEFCIFATLGKKTEGRKFNQTQILKPSETYLKDKRYNAKEWLYRLPDHWHWTTASEHNLKNKFHPTQKNVECLKDMINLSTVENEIVLDPYMGSCWLSISKNSLNNLDEQLFFLYIRYKVNDYILDSFVREYKFDNSIINDSKLNIFDEKFIRFYRNVASNILDKLILFTHHKNALHVVLYIKTIEKLKHSLNV